MFPLPPIASLQGSPMDGPVAPEPMTPLALPPPAQQPRGGGVRDILMRMAPMVLSAFTARKNPRASAALLQGVVTGQQASARQQFELEKRQEEKRSALARYMQQVASDAQQFTTPEEVAQYLDFAETIARQIDPTMPAGTMRRAIPVSSTRMADASAKKTRDDAVKKITELKSLYGENFDAVSESAAVTFKGKETPIKALLALAELNLTKEGLPVSTQKPAPKPANLQGDDLRLQATARALGKTVDTLTVDEINAALNKPAGSDTRSLDVQAADALARGDTATYQRLLKVKREMGQADDRPVDPQLRTLRDIAIANAQTAQANKPALPARVQTQVNARIRAFDAQPVVKRVQTMAEGVEFVTSLDPNTQSPADDQALIYAFAKAMDPESVVREGEYKTVEKYSQSWLQAFGFNAARVVSNTEFLTPQARAQLKATIRAKFNATKTQYDNLRRTYGEQINKATGGLDGADYLTDYGGAFPQQQGGAAAAPVQRKVGEIVTKRDGSRWRVTGFAPDGRMIAEPVR
jgi:hypothetical protein